MKRLHWALLLLITSFAFTQKSYATNDTIPEEIKPSYDYAPDFSYEELQSRYDILDLEIDIAFNDQVKAFINYS